MKLKILTKNLKNKDYTQNIDTINELNNRIINPLFIPSLTILAFLLMTTSKEYINKTALKIIIFFFGVLIIVISEFLLNISSKKINIIILLYINQIVSYLRLILKVKILRF